MNWKYSFREFRDWDPELADAVIGVIEAAEDTCMREDLPSGHRLSRALDELERYLSDE